METHFRRWPWLSGLPFQPDRVSYLHVSVSNVSNCRHNKPDHVSTLMSLIASSCCFNWMSWCRQTPCASVSYQLIPDHFHTVILSGMPVIHPADGDLRDETYYSVGRRSGSPPSRRTFAGPRKDQLPSRKRKTVSVLQFNEKIQNVSEDTSL